MQREHDLEGLTQRDDDVDRVLALPKKLADAGRKFSGRQLVVLLGAWAGRILNPVPEPDEPTPDELPEIGRRLCGLLGVEPEEPVSASALRAIANDRSSGVPKARWTVILAVRICADAMAVHELPAEIRELRNAIDAYARYMLQSQEVRQRLAVALQKAIPSLEREAATRFKSRAPDGGEHAEAAGQSSTWPSPEALVDLPRKLLDLVPQEFGMVGRMRQVLHDLSRVDGDPRIVPRFAPTNIRMAKALDLAGYSAAEIATIIKPFAKTGTARKQARNTVLRYLTSKSEDMLLAWSIPPDAPDRAQRVKELEEALDRVMGMADAKVRRVAVGSAPDAAPDSVPSSSR